MSQRKLTSQQTIDFIKGKVGDKSITFDTDSKKHSIIGYQNFKESFELKLPLPFPAMKKDEKVENYFNRLPTDLSPYTILLIQAGHSAIGYFENGKTLHHKVLRAYMVRKTQGKNQLTLIGKKKNVSSSGSKLRYNNAIKFFEEINKTLNQWGVIKKSERILYSCPIKMWQFVFNSKVKCFFDKKDSRLHKIPLDIGIPNFEEMMRVNKKISFGYLTTFAKD